MSIPRREPTNADIITAITGMSAELGGVKAELVEVKNQVTYTNGQVRVLNQWKSDQEAGQKAVERYKREHESAQGGVAQVKVENHGSVVDWKAVGSALGLIIIGIAAYVAQAQGSR